MILRRLQYFLSQIKMYQNQGASYGQLKHFFKYYKSIQPGASSVKDEQPWLTYDVIDFLKKNVNKTSKVFEYGGGGSTLFFVPRAAEVVTVEHNKDWFAILSKMVQEKNYKNWRGSFHLAEKGDLVSNPEKGNPDHYSSGDAESKGFNYKAYVTHIDQFADGYFDFVLVDGRSRSSCIKHSVSKLKKGGFLILDNSDRAYYYDGLKEIFTKHFEVVSDNFGASPYSNEFTKTSIWIKK